MVDFSRVCNGPLVTVLTVISQLTFHRWWSCVNGHPTRNPGPGYKYVRRPFKEERKPTYLGGTDGSWGPDVGVGAHSKLR